MVSWLARYVRRVGIALVAGLIVSKVVEWCAPSNLIMWNREVITVLQTFNFPAVMHRWWVLYEPNGHLEWWRLLVAPFLGFAETLAFALNAWDEGIWAFMTTVLAILVGFNIAVKGLERISRDNREVFAAWLSPFVGAFVLWVLQHVLLLPFVLVRDVLNGVQTVFHAVRSVAVLSTMVPMLPGLPDWQTLREKILEAMKSEREHAVASKFERVVEKSHKP